MDDDRHELTLGRSLRVALAFLASALHEEGISYIEMDCHDLDNVQVAVRLRPLADHVVFSVALGD